MAQTLKDSEIRYRRLFETAQDGILILNAETGNIQDVNPYLINMLGYTREEFIQKELWQVGAFTDIAASQNAFATLQEREYIRYEDLPLRTKDGRLIQVEFVSNVYWVGSEKVIQCNIRDITDRKRAEMSAASSQERYRTTLNNMMEGCQIIDHEWRYIYVNDAAAQSSHKKPLELLMHTMMEVYPGIEGTDLFRSLQLSMHERIRQRIETQFFFGDDTYSWFELSIQPVPEGLFVLSIDITERKQAEDVLKRSEERYRSLIEQASDGIFVSDATGKYVDINTSGCEMLGYTREEILEKNFADIIAPMDKTQIPPRLDELLAGKVFISERRLVRKDGSLLYVEISSKMLLDGRMQGIVRDITERKQAEEMRIKLAAIVEASDDAIFGTWDGLINSWNRGAERLYGYTAEEAIGQPTSFLVPPDRAHEYPEIVGRVISGESIRNFETVRLRKDGTSIDVSLTISPIKDISGEPHGASTIARDITEQKRAERSLQESQQLFYGIFHASPTAIVLSSLPEGRFVQANQNFSELTGYALDEVIGMTSSEAGITADAKVREERLAALKQNVRPSSFEVQVVRKSGEIRSGLSTVGIVSLNGEQFALSNFIDITERKQAEEKLLASEAQMSSMLASLAEGIVFLDTDGTVVKINDAATQVLGLTLQELNDPHLGLRWKVARSDGSLLPLEEQPAWVALRTGQSVKNVEMGIPAEGGKLKWILASAQLVHDPKGQMVGVVTSFFDITERKHAEEMRENLAVIVEASDDAIFGTFNNVITSWNMGAERLYGYTADEMIGQPISLLTPPAHLDELNHITDQLARGASLKNIETVRLRKDGTPVNVSLTVSPIKDSLGQLRTSTIAHDITERKQAEEIRAKLAAIVESSDDAIIGKTLDGVITSWNRGAERQYGYLADEVVGQPISLLIPPDRPDELSEILARLKRGESVKHFETVRLQKNGVPLEVSLTISPIQDALGQVIGASTIAHDISERKRAEQQLAEAHTFLENILNYSPIGILTYKFTGECLTANEYAAQTVGATVDQMRAQNFRKLESWKNSGFYELAEKAIATRKQQSADIYVQTTFGKGIWLRAQFVVFQSNGEDCLLLTVGNITERKQAEQALRESERHYRQIIETTQEGVWTIDANQLTTLANQRLADLFGYTIEEMMGQPVDTFLDDEGKAIAPFALENRRQGIDRQLDFKFKRKDGSAVWALVETNTLRDAQGNYAGTLAMLTDITSRKQMEDALRINEERLSLALTATQTGVWEWNAQTNQVYWSPECYEIVGMALSTEKTLKGFLGLVHPDDVDRVNASIQQSLKYGEQFYVDFRTINHHGELIWLQDIGRAEYDANGTPTRMIGTVSNVTERKKSEELIRESDNRFRALLQNSADAITLLDDKGTVIYDSPAAPGMLGYTPNDWIGQDVFNLVHPEDLPEIQSLFENLVQRSGARLYMTFRVRHKNQFWVWLEVVATNLLGQPGVNAIVLNYRDITKRKQADERLRSAREFLQSVQDAISSHIAILDDSGTIVQVNAAWRAFGAKNALIHSDDCIGMNYLEICDKAVGINANEAAMVARAIREVRSGEAQETWVEYPCHSPNEQRWFIVRITGFENNGRKWLAVTHTNITERKQIETEIQQRLSELEVLYQSGLAFSHLLSPKTIAKKMIDLLDRKMDWHHTAIRLYHPESKTLELLAFHLPDHTSLEDRNAIRKRFKRLQRLDQGLTGWVLQHGKAVRCNDLKKDVRYFETFPNLQSGLYIPIKIADRVLGVISIESERLNAFRKSDERLVVTLAAQVAIAIENAQLFERLKRSNLNLVSAYDATIEGWSRALDLRDKETEGHSLRVTEMTLMLAHALGLSDDELAQIRWGALLHDIGKMGVPDGILLKPGPLTDDEWAIMRKHPTFAYEMLSPIEYLRRALDIPYCHHEKWDGSGYPRGLKGEQIPRAARIFAVIDVWDALRSDRPYRAGWDDEKVREHIRFSSGTHFDPAIVDVFMKIFG